MAEARQCQTVRLKIIYLEVLRSLEDLFRCMTISEFLIEGAIGLTLKAYGDIVIKCLVSLTPNSTPYRLSQYRATAKARTVVVVGAVV